MLTYLDAQLSDAKVSKTELSLNGGDLGMVAENEWDYFGQDYPGCSGSLTADADTRRQDAAYQTTTITNRCNLSYSRATGSAGTCRNYSITDDTLGTREPVPRHGAGVRGSMLRAEPVGGSVDAAGLGGAKAAALCRSRRLRFRAHCGAAGGGLCAYMWKRALFAARVFSCAARLRSSAFCCRAAST